MAAPAVLLFLNRLYRSVGAPSEATNPIFLRYGRIASPVPPLICSLVVMKSCVTRSGVAAARMRSSAVFIEPGAASYGSDAMVQSQLCAS